MKSGRLVAMLAASLLPSLVWAHPAGPANFSLLSGVAHPFLGGDHLLVMLMVGLWAAQQEGWKRALGPLTFVSFMALGAVLASLGVNALHLESMLGLSVLALGLLAVFALRLPILPTLTLIGSFAVYHGIAHGSELPLAASLGYMPGYLLATALLHGIGYYLTRRLKQNAYFVRSAGGLTALTGLIWLVQ